jgi:hypothetical protein
VSSSACCSSLALLHDDAERARVYLCGDDGAVALATVPICLGLFAAAAPFVIGVLGPQWGEAILLLRLLSLTGCSRVHRLFHQPRACGRPDVSCA